MSKNRICRNSATGGFTLVEIMVVLVVIAIVVAVAAPYVVSTKDLQVISATRMIAADLQYAQSLAITSQSQTTVSFNSGNESYSLTNESGSVIHPMTKSDYVVNFSTLGGFEHLNIVSANFNGSSSVSFDSLGSPVSAGEVTVQAGPHIYRVDVAAATGRVSVTAVSP